MGDAWVTQALARETCEFVGAGDGSEVLVAAAVAQMQAAEIGQWIFAILQTAKRGEMSTGCEDGLERKTGAEGGNINQGGWD